MSGVSTVQDKKNSQPCCACALRRSASCAGSSSPVGSQYESKAFITYHLSLITYHLLFMARTKGARDRGPRKVYRRHTSRRLPPAPVQLAFTRWKATSFSYHRAMNILACRFDKPEFAENLLYMIFLDGFHAHRVMALDAAKEVAQATPTPEG